MVGMPAQILHANMPIVGAKSPQSSNQMIAMQARQPRLGSI